MDIWIYLRPLIFVGLVFGLFGLYFGFEWRRSKRRQRLFTKPLPEQWKQFLDKYIDLYRLLPLDLKEQLHGHIQIFLSEKRIIGAKGFTIDDSIRLTIAAQACLLLLNKEKVTYFTGLRDIIVYPGSYKAPQTRRVGGIDIEETHWRQGEAWGQRGQVILSWQNILQDLQMGNGHNLVIHEFAHQLDRENGAWDGTPVLENREHYKLWGNVFTSAYSDLRRRIHSRRPSVINTYGATNESEFFAVVSEHFFDQPWVLDEYYPKLYDALKLYYKLDPLQWYQSVLQKTT